MLLGDRTRRPDHGRSPRSPTGCGSPAIPGSTSTSPSSAATAAWSSSTPTARPRRPGGRRRRPRARRRRRGRRSSTPTSTSTTPSATRPSARSTAPAARPRDRRGCRRGRSRPASGSRRDYDAATDDPHRDEVLATAIVPADQRSPRPSVLDLGDRPVELVHPGRGHTGGDLVVRVPDADVLLAGDLVEESRAPGLRRRLLPAGLAADPRPRARPDHAAARSSCPGHGAVGRPGRSCRTSAQTIGIVAETIRDLAGRGVPVAEALAAGSGRSRASGWRTPYAVATSSCPGPRSGCR